MSKVFGIRPDIIPIRDDDPEPVFDLILGVETLTRFGVILDFSQKVITLDQITNAMRPLEAFNRERLGNRIYKQKIKFPPPPLEPISTREATKRTIEILDANYEKPICQNLCKKIAAI